MNYRLHPQAALEHEAQVAYYEDRATGLGVRYHVEFRKTVKQICQNPSRFKMLKKPDIRQGSIDGFPFFVVFRAFNGDIEILAVAHYRKKPNYWSKRG